MNKDEMTTEEFRAAIRTGQLEITGGQVKSVPLSPPYKDMLAKEGKLFDDRQYIDHEKITPKKDRKGSIFDYQKERNRELIEYLRSLISLKIAIYIKGNVPSSKNSKEIQQIFLKTSVCHEKEMIKRADGVWLCSYCMQPAQRKTRPILAPSKLCKDYIAETGMFWQQYRQQWNEMIKGKEYPLQVGMYFVRNSRHDFDFNNASQIICDLMVTNEWINDDNMLYLEPIPLGFHYEKAKAGIVFGLMDKTLYQFKIQRL